MKYAFRLLFLLPFFHPLCLKSQMADRATHDRIKDSIITYYNAKNFKAIFNLGTDEMKESMNEKDSQKFFETKVYKLFGSIDKDSYLKEEEGFHAYLLSFGGPKLKLNLGVDTEGHIAFIQFLPYRRAPSTKRSTWLSDNKKNNALDSLVDRTLNEYLQNPANCGISIAVYSNGKTHFYNYGEMKMNSGTLAGKNTLYEIGSVSKTFCGILLAQAIIEKKVKAEDDIRKYLPGSYPNLELNGKAIRLTHLANHTAGLKKIPDDLTQGKEYEPLNPYKHYTKGMLFEYLKTVKPETEPGTVCNYSNMGMALLGIILEKVYGKTFEELVKEKITDPCGLTDTRVTLNEEQMTRFADGYNDDGESTPHWDLGDLAAAGGLRSTPADMLQYLRCNMEENNNAIKLSHKLTFNGRQKVGLSWFIKETAKGNSMVWHNGATFGFVSFCAYIKEKNACVAILSNSSAHVDFLGIAIMNYLEGNGM